MFSRFCIFVFYGHIIFVVVVVITAKKNHFVCTPFFRHHFHMLWKRCHKCAANCWVKHALHVKIIRGVRNYQFFGNWGRLFFLTCDYGSLRKKEWIAVAVSTTFHEIGNLGPNFYQRLIYKATLIFTAIL
jgi:hypothetical protein